MITLAVGAAAGVVAWEDVLRELGPLLAPYLVDQLLGVMRVLSGDVSVLRALIWGNVLLAAVLLVQAPGSAYWQPFIAYCVALILHGAALALTDNPVPLSAGNSGLTREAGYLLMSASLLHAIWLRRGGDVRAPLTQLIALALGVLLLATDRLHYRSVCCAVSAFGVLCVINFLCVFRDVLSRGARLSLTAYGLVLVARPALFDNECVQAANAYALLMLLKYPALFSVVGSNRLQAGRRSSAEGEREADDDATLRKTLPVPA